MTAYARALRPRWARNGFAGGLGMAPTVSAKHRPARRREAQAGPPADEVCNSESAVPLARDAGMKYRRAVLIERRAAPKANIPASRGRPLRGSLCARALPAFEQEKRRLR